jgi:signal transduction histidine kinase
MSTTLRTPAALGTDADDASDTPSLDAAQDLLRGYLPALSAQLGTIDDAAHRARTIAAAGAESLGPTVLLSELLPEVCRDDAVDAEDVRSVVDATAELTGTPCDLFRLQLAQAAVAGRTINELAPEPAIERTLRLARVLTPVRHISLWEHDQSGTAVCVSHVGPLPSRRTADLARLRLTGNRASGYTGFLVGIPVLRGHRPAAVLMARPAANGRARCEALLRAIAPVIGGLLERRSLAERAAATERVLAEASERRLVRLAFDLHDGPLQNVAGVRGDLAQLRRRLGGVLEEPRTRSHVLGCLDDLEARLHAIDTELRDLSHSLESPNTPHVPFTRVLEAEVEAFGRRTDIRAGLETNGNFVDLTESQRIALWRIVQESLANVREHSCASEVRVRAVAGPETLEVTVTDDGRGFEVAQTLLDAARRGRLGLVGVSERARLLGGRCVVSSRHGGPTSVAVTLPRWRPQS